MQRNSINESIYSEPFSNGRLNARPSPNINNQSLNDHRSHHSYADISNRTLPLIRNSLGSGGGAGGGIGNHIQQLSASTSRTIENNIDKTNATMSLSTSYGINKFRSLDRVRAVQSCDFDVNSVQSNSIELNCIIDKKSETDNNEIKCSNDTTTTTNITNTDSNLNKADTEQKHHRNDDKNTQANSASKCTLLFSFLLFSIFILSILKIDTFYFHYFFFALFVFIVNSYKSCATIKTSFSAQCRSTCSSYFVFTGNCKRFFCT